MVNLVVPVTACSGRAVPGAVFRVTRRSGEPSARFCASEMMDGCTYRAVGVGSYSGLGESPDAVLQTLYAPFASVAAEPEVVSMKDAARSVSTCGHCLRYKSTRAFIPRFTWRNVAGVFKPAKPLVSVNGKVAPPACKCVRAESSMSEIRK